MRRPSLSLLALLTFTACGAPQGAPPVTPTPSEPQADIHTPPAETRAFRTLVLDNGMKVLLASDPDTTEAAAHMVVSVGSLDAPADRDGLAHFLEHMLFIGTEKYPEPNGYKDYLAAHGGRSNAFTSTETTQYFFTINAQAFEEGFDRFAQFFRSPLLDPAYSAKEREAVNAEYKMKEKEPSRRYRAALQQTRNPEHPWSHFTVGNLDTLADRDGRPIFEDLRSFYDAHYVADNMILALVAKPGHHTRNPVSKLKSDVSLDRLNTKLVERVVLGRCKIPGICPRLKNPPRSNYVETRKKKAAHIGAFTHVLLQPSGFVFKNLLFLPLGKSGESE